MIPLTVAQVAEIVGGELADVSAADAARLHITGTVEFDSRKITPGGLFLALPGARSDGHDHAAAAVQAGAVAVLAALVAWFAVALITGDGLAGLAERLFGAGQALWPLAVVASCRHAARKDARASLNPPDVSVSRTDVRAMWPDASQ